MNLMQEIRQALMQLRPDSGNSRVPALSPLPRTQVAEIIGFCEASISQSLRPCLPLSEPAAEPGIMTQGEAVEAFRRFAIECWRHFQETNPRAIDLYVDRYDENRTLRLRAECRGHESWSATIDTRMANVLNVHPRSIGEMFRNFYTAAAIRGIAAKRRNAISPEKLAVETLKRFLNPDQLADYVNTQSFVVIGNATGKRYRILPAQTTNIRELNKRGEPCEAWCFLPAPPAGPLPMADVQLMQKLCLECDETETIKIAVHQGSVHPTIPTEIYEADMDALAGDVRAVAGDFQRVIGDMGVWIDESGPIPEGAWEFVRTRVEIRPGAVHAVRMATQEEERDRRLRAAQRISEHAYRTARAANRIIPWSIF